MGSFCGPLYRVIPISLVGCRPGILLASTLTTLGAGCGRPECSRLTGGPAFPEKTVSIPRDKLRKDGEVAWPRKLPTNPQTDFATLRTVGKTRCG